MQVETITSEVAINRQDVILVEHLKYGNNKLRLKIRSDSYVSQCSAVLEAFSPTDLKWNVVASRPYGSMQTENGLAYFPKEKLLNVKQYFKADRDWLLNVFKALID